MGTLALVLFAVALVVFVTIMVRGMRRRRRARRSYSAQQSGEDDSPTGYVQGVWLLGGADSATPHNQHHDRQQGAGHDGSDGGGDAGGSDGGGSH
jgi:hypothetical protein